jgi:hypothetical protein
MLARLISISVVLRRLRLCRTARSIAAWRMRLDEHAQKNRMEVAADLFGDRGNRDLDRDRLVDYSVDLTHGGV